MRIVALKLKLRRSKITHNADGVIIIGNGADLGTTSDSGDNVFSDNNIEGVSFAPAHLRGPRRRAAQPRAGGGGRYAAAERGAAGGDAGDGRHALPTAGADIYSDFKPAEGDTSDGT